MSDGRGASGEPGWVVAGYAQRCLVWWEEQEWDCTVGGRLLRAGGVVVGDRVDIVPEGATRGRVETVLPRETELRRTKVGRGRRAKPVQQVLAANVQQLLIVGSIQEPPFRMGLAERFLVAASKAGLRPLVVVTKLDLDSGGEFAVLAAAFREVDVPVLGTALARPESVAPLERALAGRVSVLVGHSGVGKSSLINAVARTELAVGSVDDRYRRGRHTTSTARMIPLREGGWVIDSPGVREFGLQALSSQDLARFFPGMAPVLGDCAFPDCLHDQETGCGVRRALAAGQIPPARYEGYLKLLAEVREQEQR